MKFYKMSGAGNDFILIRDTSHILSSFNKFITAYKHLSPAQLSRILCDRRHSIGADGLLLLKRKSNKILKVRYFNSDGSEAFCANGFRCAAWFAYSQKIIHVKNFFLDTIKGKLPVKISGYCRNRPGAYGSTGSGLLKNKISARVVLKIPDVNSIFFNFSGKFPRGIKEVHFLNTGVPHAVVPVKDINKINVESLGRMIRFNKCFGKEGANVNFVCLKNQYTRSPLLAPFGAMAQTAPPRPVGNHPMVGETLTPTRRVSRSAIYLRTYERGVEAETLACGTGSVASAIALGILHKLKQPIKCITKSGETFSVWFKTDAKNSVKDVYLEGPAKIVFKGEINIGCRV